MTVNIDELVKEQGFCVVPTDEKQFSLDEARFNLLAYLEDYSKMGFSFVKAGNELVELRRKQESYRLFDQCFLGVVDNKRSTRRWSRIWLRKNGVFIHQRMIGIG